MSRVYSPQSHSCFSVRMQSPEMFGISLPNFILLEGVDGAEEHDAEAAGENQRAAVLLYDAGFDLTGLLLF